jgi:hypothetical protein
MGMAKGEDVPVHARKEAKKKGYTGVTGLLQPCKWARKGENGTFE